MIWIGISLSVLRMLRNQWNSIFDVDENASFFALVYYLHGPIQ